MKTIALIAIACLMLTGCDKKELSAAMYEDALVKQSVFLPGQHGDITTIGNNFGKDGGLTVSSGDISIDEKFIVVFECQHGQFAVEGSTSFEKGVWQKCKVGETVSIQYCEQYIVSKNSRKFNKYVFLGVDRKAEK